MSLELEDRLLVDVKLMIPSNYYSRRRGDGWRVCLLLQAYGWRLSSLHLIEMVELGALLWEASLQSCKVFK